MLVIVCTLYRYRWKIRYAVYKVTTKSAVGERQPLIGSQNKFAAFLSHCSKRTCKDFVCRQLLPRIDNNKVQASC